MSRSTKNPAIFNQISEFPLKERIMIEKATIREVLIDQLENISDLIKLKQIEIDMKCIFDIFRLLGKIREATIAFIFAFVTWEEEYTRYTPPKIYGCKDYIDEMLIVNTRILGASVIKTIFNFNLISGNILLLPMKSKTEVPIIDLDRASNDEIIKFASPDIDEMTTAYQALVAVLPDSLFRKLIDVGSCFDRPWSPPINRNDSLDERSILVSELLEKAIRKFESSSVRPNSVVQPAFRNGKIFSSSNAKLASSSSSKTNKNKVADKGVRNLSRVHTTRLTSSRKNAQDTTCKNTADNRSKATMNELRLPGLDDTSLSLESALSASSDLNASRSSAENISAMPLAPVSTNSLREWYFRENRR
jgi:hypothetical protein